MRTLLLLLLIGCPQPNKATPGGLFEPITNPDGDDTGTWTGTSTTILGKHVDAGFGSAVLVSGGRVWASAPHGSPGAVYDISEGHLQKVYRGSGRLGSSLAMGDQGIWIGAPLYDNGAGAVFNAAGDLIVAGTGSTGLSMASGSPPTVAHGNGYSNGDGAVSATIHRPTSVAHIGNTVGIGMASGDVALFAGDASLARPKQGDGAGFALASGDFDGDGTKEWAVGAPGSATVHIVHGETLEIRRSLTGEGGFGSALCAADFDGDGQDELVVGAPSAEFTRGQVVVYANALSASSPFISWTAETAGDRLGTAVDCSRKLAALGAPGGATSVGAVHIKTGESIAAAGGSASRPARPQSE